jgi:hypothetical protein
MTKFTTKFTPSLTMLAAVLALGLNVAPAQALNARSFISALGSDANPCTRPLPCRTLQTAHNNTSAGGEINMLDPAGYGTVTISKAISIVNDGVGSAGVLVPASATGIEISAGATDKINLRGLIIEGAGIGGYGILFHTGQSLNIQNCVIRGLGLQGIRLIPSASTALFVSNTLIADNVGSGIAIVPTGAGTVTAALNHVELDNNGNNGLEINGALGSGTINATLTESSIANSGARGVEVSSDAAAPTALMIRHSALVNNGTNGVYVVGSTAKARLTDSTITGNGTGWAVASGGTLSSYIDNNIDGNAGGETAPPTLSKK